MTGEDSLDARLREAQAAMQKWTGIVSEKEKEVSAGANEIAEIDGQLRQASNSCEIDGDRNAEKLIPKLEGKLAARRGAQSRKVTALEEARRRFTGARITAQELAAEVNARDARRAADATAEKAKAATQSFYDHFAEMHRAGKSRDEFLAALRAMPLEAGTGQAIADINRFGHEERGRTAKTLGLHIDRIP